MAAIVLEEQYTNKGKVVIGGSLTNNNNNIPKLFHDLVKKDEELNKNKREESQTEIKKNSINFSLNQIPNNNSYIDDEDEDDQGRRIGHRISNEISESVELLDFSDYSSAIENNNQTQSLFVEKEKDFDEIYFNR